MLPEPNLEQAPVEKLKRYYGKYPGIVVNNKQRDDGDAKTYGAHRGEVLVSVSGILEEDPDGEGERPIQVWAKPCFMPGFFFVPDKDAQVWVEFVAGDINEPIWTGVWYPKDASPQTADQQAPTQCQKIIRTTSGHVVQFDDVETKEKIIISHKNGATVTLNAEKDEVAIADRHDNVINLTENGILLQDKNGTVLRMEGGKVEILANGKIILRSPILLGENARDPLVLGNRVFKTLWELLAKHTHATAMGPSGPPIPPLTPPIDGAFSKGVSSE